MKSVRLILVTLTSTQYHWRGSLQKKLSVNNTLHHQKVMIYSMWLSWSLGAKSKITVGGLN